jgi:hypothetical protein
MWIMKHRWNTFLRLTSATFLLVGNYAVHGGDTLKSTISELVGDIEGHLGDEGRKIKIGEFKSEGNSNIDVYSRRLATELQTQLGAKDRISEDADQMIQGTYRIDPKSGAIEIRSRIVTGSGRALQALVANGKDGEFLQADPDRSLVAVPNATPDKDLKPKKLRAASETLLALQSPIVLDLDVPETPARIVEQITTAGPDQNLFMIKDGYLVMKDVNLGIRLQEINPQIQDRGSPSFLGATVTPRKIYPFFRLHEGKSYMIELKNFRTDIDLGVKVLFDGIDSTALSFSENDRERLLWIVSKQSNVGVYGWYRDESTTDAFQINPEEQSLAYQMRTTASIGKIQVIVYAAWDKKLNASIPLEFLRPNTRGVGQGEKLNLEIRKLDMEIGRLMGQMVVDYDTEPVPGIGIVNEEVSISLVQGLR